MTKQEEIFVQQCEWMLDSIRLSYASVKGPVLVCVNALREQINKIKGVPGSRTAMDEQGGFLVGLTFDDIYHLHNGGSVTVSTEGWNLPPLQVHIFLGGTHEHMEKGMQKHPDTTYKVTDSHKDQQN